MKNILNFFGKIFVLLIFVFAIWLLYQKLQAYSLVEIRQSIEQIPISSIVLSLFFMILNYVILMGYDWLALKAIKKQLAFRKISLVSFVGSVISVNFGALLGGSAVRYRLYSLWGFSPFEIIRLVVMVGFTFWVGAMGLAGVLFILVPLELPTEFTLHFIDIRFLGVFLLAVCVLYHFICWLVDGKAIIIRGKEFALPPFKISLAQTCIAGLELIAAAACLYVLLPVHDDVSFFWFLPNYLLAQVIAVLTHVPGGIGVLEVILMNLMSGIPASGVFAAILTFRVIYYLLPLFFASVLLGVNELLVKKNKNNIDSDKEALNEWFLTLMKYSVFAVGVLFCLSVVFPVTQSSTYIADVESNIVALVAYFMRGVVGVFLVIFAYGLDRRQKNHWLIVVCSLILGLICGSLSGGNWLESLVILSVFFPLVVSSNKFTRQRELLASHYPRAWLITAILVFLGIVGLTIYFTSLTDYYHAWNTFFNKGYIEYYAIGIEIVTGIIICIMLIMADKVKKRRLRYNEHH